MLHRTLAAFIRLLISSRELLIGSDGAARYHSRALKFSFPVLLFFHGWGGLLTGEVVGTSKTKPARGKEEGARASAAMPVTVCLTHPSIESINLEWKLKSRPQTPSPRCLSLLLLGTRKERCERGNIILKRPQHPVLKLDSYNNSAGRITWDNVG